ncbi:MAG TPA: hypothetical protein VJT67_01275 [Longimicrobiaceae bacterium]|nr:hypothetical protein [Longimicrobiaceae bacterium]
MPTPLDKPLKREITVDGTVYVLTVTPEGLHLAPKGKRKGVDLTWKAMVSGDAALAAELRASVERLG